MAKERLVVLLGAGASIGARVPSTKDLTELIVDTELRGMVDDRRYWYDDPKFGPDHKPAIMPPVPSKGVPVDFYRQDPIYKMVHASLSKRFKDPNFEHILAALDELQSIAQSQETGSGSVDKFVHVLSPMIEVDPSHPILREWRFLMYARAELLRIISRKFQERLLTLDMSVLSQFVRLFHCLSERFNLSVFTLNYDDLVERTGLKWFDGFTVRGSDHYKFDRAVFRKEHGGIDNLLCHLHGSIYFAYDREPPGNPLDELARIVRYDDPGQALQALEGIGTGEKNDMGTLVSGGPIITGFHKVAKLSLAPVPYGYYYKALTDVLLECPRILVIGYGGMDSHINAWLNEFVMMHGSTRKSVYITPLPFKKSFERSPLDRIFVNLSGQSNVIERTHFDNHPGQVEYMERGQMAVCGNGFPFADEKITTESLLKFLS